MDIKELKDRNNIEDVIGKYIELSPHAGELRGLCCFHDERTPSLMVNPRKQIFKCFGCGAAGDVLDFLVKRGMQFHEAVKELEDPTGTGSPIEKKASTRQPVVQWKDATPHEPCKEIRHKDHGIPSKYWAYRNASGKIIGYACRFDLPGEKMVLPLTYKTDGERTGWVWRGFDKPRPLYNLDKITANPDKSILMVEGEKTADAAAKLFPHVVVTTWMGGADGIRSVDLTPLHGRKVVFWPDNDWSHEYGDKHAKAGQLKPFHEQPGNGAMLTISSLLGDNCTVKKWIKNPEGAPCGWDVADTEWTPEEALIYLRANIIDVPVINDQPEAPVIPPAALMNDLPKEKVKYEVPPIPKDPEEHEQPRHKGNEWFKCLGYDKADSGGQHYYFYAFAPKTVIKLSPSAMSKSNLMQLAPINWWESNFPGKNGMSTDSAQNFLVNRCHDVGIFNERCIRGRGAWIDKKEIVIHAGNHLIVNGKPLHFKDFKSKYIYEIGEEMEFDFELPLHKENANKLMDVMKLLNWEREIDPYLLAGWCVVAPVCGSLNWRPHVWLTGAAGSGKSWTLKHLVRRLLGETALAVQGETTEAGLRQTLRHDALPVVFDEADGNDRRAQDRMQDVLSLMRSASAHDSGVMAKGSALGSARTYRIRSCFLFASISVQIRQQSDRTRVSVLSLKNYPSGDPGKADRWSQLQRLFTEVITEDYCRQLRARTIAILPIILENARVFSAAAAAVLGEQRAGDQIGALLAGAYSLSSDHLITYDQAVKWVNARNWSEERAQETTRDEIRLFGHLMSQITKVETSVGAIERTVGELAMYCLKMRSDMLLTEDLCDDKLRRLGIRVRNGYVIVSDNEPAIKAMLRDTPWSSNHNKILLRIEGSEIVSKERFANGIEQRAVKVKASGLLSDS